MEKPGSELEWAGGGRGVGGSGVLSFPGLASSRSEPGKRLNASAVPSPCLPCSARPLSDPTLLPHSHLQSGHTSEVPKDSHGTKMCCGQKRARPKHHPERWYNRQVPTARTRESSGLMIRSRRSCKAASVPTPAQYWQLPRIASTQDLPGHPLGGAASFQHRSDLIS